MQKLSMQELGRLSPEDVQQVPRQKLVVVLDNVRSMHNVGSVFRTGDAFLVEAIYLCGYTPVPPHRDIHKTALGATETVPWKHFSHIDEALQQLRERGYYLAAVEQTDASIPLQQFQQPSEQGLALVLGNEVEGVQQSALDLCHQAVEIPQFGTKHSLNIAVAAGIVLWQILSPKN